MSSRHSEDGRIIRCYSVTDPTLHPKGHTVYKVIEKKLDVEAFDEAVQESVSWKRYNEFYKLYMSLSSLHVSLHRKEEFPDFPKPQMFRRFDDDVIKDRMQCAQDLLNFIGQRKYLVESRAFKEFFQDLKVLEPTVDDSILQPTTTNSNKDSACKSNYYIFGIPDKREMSENEDDDDELGDESSYTEDDDYDEYYDDDADAEMFGSSYDTFSARGVPSDETRSLDSLIGEHCMTQSLQVEMIRNDCDVHHSADVSSDFQHSSNISSVGCGNDDKDGVKSQGRVVEGNQSIVSLESEVDPTIEFSKKSGGLVRRGFLKKSFFPMQAIWKTGKNLKHLLSASFHGSLPSPSKEDSKKLQKKKLMDMLGMKSYISEAASTIRDAKVKENCGQFGDAFDLYKSAIGTMLNGVQNDTNSECIEFVRSNISKYLTKAEELYKVHLQCHEPYLFMPSNTNKYCRNISLLRGLSTDLGNFKVIGILNKVMLVVDESLPKSDTYVMKVYPKTSFLTRNQTNIVPSHVPFMLGIIKFYETETAIYALLPHVATGTLWNHVAGYMHHSIKSDSTPDVFDEAQDEVSAQPGEHERSNESPLVASLPIPSNDVEELSSENLENSDLFYEANGIMETESICKLKTSHHSRSPSDGVANSSDCDFRELLKKNTSQCLSLFSINSSEGEVTPAILNTQTQTFDQTLLSENESGLDDDDDLKVTKDSVAISSSGEELCKNSQTSNSLIDVDIAELKSKNADPKSVVKQLSLGLSSSCSEISKKNVYESSKVRTSSSTCEELDLSGCFRFQASSKEERKNVILLPEKCVRLWAAEMVVAISCLHDCGIICRDLNPDNILIDAKGHIVLTYFCQWTTVEQTIRSSTIDNFYCAPELSSVAKVTKACDWWSFGVILFELLTGMSLQHYRPCGISQHTFDFFPSHLSIEAQSLLRKIIVYNASERIGSEDIRSHSFFQGIEWNTLYCSLV